MAFISTDRLDGSFSPVFTPILGPSASHRKSTTPSAGRRRFMRSPRCPQSTVITPMITDFQRIFSVDLRFLLPQTDLSDDDAVFFATPIVLPRSIISLLIAFCFVPTHSFSVCERVQRRNLTPTLCRRTTPRLRTIRELQPPARKRKRNNPSVDYPKDSSLPVPELCGLTIRSIEELDSPYDHAEEGNALELTGLGRDSHSLKSVYLLPKRFSKWTIVDDGYTVDLPARFAYDHLIISATVVFRETGPYLKLLLEETENSSTCSDTEDASTDDEDVDLKIDPALIASVRRPTMGMPSPIDSLRVDIGTKRRPSIQTTGGPSEQGRRPSLAVDERDMKENEGVRSPEKTVTPQSLDSWLADEDLSSPNGVEEMGSDCESRSFMPAKKRIEIYSCQINRHELRKYYHHKLTPNPNTPEKQKALESPKMPKLLLEW